MAREVIEGTAVRGPYSPAIIAEGRFVFVSGQGPLQAGEYRSGDDRGRDAADARERRRPARAGRQRIRARRPLRSMDHRSAGLRRDERRLPVVLPGAETGSGDGARRPDDRKGRDRLHRARALRLSRSPGPRRCRSRHRSRSVISSLASQQMSDATSSACPIRPSGIREVMYETCSRRPARGAACRSPRARCS